MMTVTNQARCEQHYEQRYEQWAAPLRGRPGVVRALNIVNHGIVVVFYAAYALLLGWACVSDPWKLAPLVGVTAVGFAAVSFFRRRFNAPRPYECCSIAPLIARDGAGKSFPSRHAFSAFAIAAKLVCGQRARCRRAAGCGCARGLPRSRRRTFRVTSRSPGGHGCAALSGAALKA